VCHRIHELELDEVVVLHGELSPARVGAMYAAADVFALPSVGEAFGMAFAEAMSAGLPVVAVRSGNVPELVTDGHEGLLVDPFDVPGLARALRRLVDDEALRRDASRAARMRARRLPTWDASAARFAAALLEAVGRPQSASEPASPVRRSAGPAVPGGASLP
jgi:glycosyltransferase involved in cell wall biosynthesis